MTRQYILASLIGSAIFLAPGSTVASAQPPQTTPPPAFEVASIKANHSFERLMLFQPARGGRFTATNCSLNLLIQYAFDIMRYQITGGPAWAKSDRYDIAAKAGGDPPMSKIPAMLQRLLEDRFQLEYHWETRESAVYDLVVSNSGKLRMSEPGECQPPLSASGPQPGASPADAPCGGVRNTPGHTKGYMLTAQDIAGSLAFFMGAMVRDKTGLRGKFDIELEWMPESVQMQSPPSAESHPAPVGSGAPSIFTAVKEQLGLTLQPARGPVKLLVIDRLERPSPN